MARNTVIPAAAGAARAPAIATPMNGAVQGVATSTASSPVAKSPAWPDRLAQPCPVPASLRPSSNAPTRFSPTRNSSQQVPATNASDWNWNPQPTVEPAARRPSISPPSEAKASRMPAV